MKVGALIRRVRDNHQTSVNNKTKDLIDMAEVSMGASTRVGLPMKRFAE